MHHVQGADGPVVRLTKSPLLRLLARVAGEGEGPPLALLVSVAQELLEFAFLDLSARAFMG